MKKKFYQVMTAAAVVAAVLTACKEDSNTLNLSIANFVTSATWKVGNQEWSDAVQATGCNKSTFNGGSSGNSFADCCSNPNQKGSLFSWQAVVDSKDQLCPSGWRVPTKDDFVALNTALDEMRVIDTIIVVLDSVKLDTNKLVNPIVIDTIARYEHNDTINLSLHKKYLSYWGVTYNGFSHSNGLLADQDLSANYWTQSEYTNANYAYGLKFYSDDKKDILPQHYSYKYYGYTLRCVRDTQ